MFSLLTLQNNNFTLQPFTNTMKKFVLISGLAFLLFSCGSKKKGPDVSKIKVDLPIERFDQIFFSMDTNHLKMGLQKTAAAFPDFYIDFMQQVLGIDAHDSSTAAMQRVKVFLKDYQPIESSILETFKNTDGLKKELITAFQYVKYYFPNYKTGKLILFTGPFDAPGVATTRTGLAVGLQQFAGKDFPAYLDKAFQEMFPSYISRRFSKEYITANCMKAVVEDLFPDKSKGLPLIEQMIEKGKQWYLLDKFLPNTPDTLKTGYTRQQLEWCKEYEGLIWSYIVKNEDLNSINPEIIQNYIGEAPFTQGLSQEQSPGNIGQWVGWQIVKKFVSKNSGWSPEKIMNTPAREILNVAKYKPK